jgi:hypothetical protein
LTKVAKLIHRKTIHNGLQGGGIQKRTGENTPAATSAVSKKKPKIPEVTARVSSPNLPGLQHKCHAKTSKTTSGPKPGEPLAAPQTDANQPAWKAAAFNNK